MKKHYTTVFERTGEILEAESRVKAVLQQKSDYIQAKLRVLREVSATRLNL